MLCAICSDLLPFHHPCHRAHADLCHWCAQVNFGGNTLDSMPHPAPPAPPTLTPRAQAAVSAFTAHLFRVVGAENMQRMMVEESPHE